MSSRPNYKRITHWLHTESIRVSYIVHVRSCEPRDYMDFGADIKLASFVHSLSTPLLSWYTRTSEEWWVDTQVSTLYLTCFFVKNSGAHSFYPGLHLKGTRSTRRSTMMARSLAANCVDCWPWPSTSRLHVIHIGSRRMVTVPCAK